MEIKCIETYCCHCSLFIRNEYSIQIYIYIESQNIEAEEDFSLASYFLSRCLGLGSSEWCIRKLSQGDQQGHSRSGTWKKSRRGLISSISLIMEQSSEVYLTYNLFQLEKKGLSLHTAAWRTFCLWLRDTVETCSFPHNSDSEFFQPKKCPV